MTEGEESDANKELMWRDKKEEEAQHKEEVVETKKKVREP